MNYILRQKKPILQTEVKDEKADNKLFEGNVWSLRLSNHLMPNTNIDYFNFFKDNWAYITKVNIDTKFVQTNCEHYEQKFNYDIQRKIILAKCNCRDSKNSACNHILFGIEKIKETFGRDFFHPDYKKSKISKYLKDYELTLEDDYEKYFEFIFDENGFSHRKKEKDLYSIEKFKENNILLDLNNETKDDLVMLNATNYENTDNYGIGFCFQIGGYYNFISFIPFIGKYKKNTKELSSRFLRVDNEQKLMDKIGSRTEDEKIALLEAVKVMKLFQRPQKMVTLDMIKELFVETKNFIERYKDDYPFFIKEESDSFIRKNLTQLEFSDQNSELFFIVKEDDEFISVDLKIKIHNTYTLTSNKLLFTPVFCLKDRKVVHFFKSPKDFVYIERFIDDAPFKFLKREKEKIIKNFIAPVSEHFPVINNICKVERLSENKNIKKQLFLSDYQGEYITFKLGMEYDGNLVFTHTNEQIIKKDKIIKRNESLEDKFIEEFRELHPDFKEQEGIFLLRPMQLIENEWLLKASQKLKDKNVEIFGAKDLKSFKYNLNKPIISMSVNSNTDWFDLDIEVKFGKEKVSLRDIKKSVLNKSKYIQLKDGTLGVLPEKWVSKFSKYFKAGEVKDKSIKMSDYQFNIIDDLYDDLQKKPDFLIELQQKKENLRNLKNINSVKVPDTVKAKLRPYQQDGLNWLVFLNDNKLGGCLADDMGLGKTIQAIALLAYTKKQKKSKLPNLIVAPTSLIFNWNKEFEKFAPSIKILTYTGAKRDEMLKKINSQDVIITTYGTVLNDIVKLQKQKFYYVILDESQAIKNPNSKRYKSVRLLKSNHRLTLTGTPIENNTFDLYSQMNFLNPGLLGSMSHFRTEFSDAIDKSHNKEASDLLSQIIYPFLLRRTKNQVATELPQKTESIIYCEMEQEQRKTYEAFKDKYREYLLDKFEENGEAKSQMYVLEGLTKLRQICNSPQLLNEEEEYGNSSIKLDVLIENIKTISSEGSKMLVFSQFTSMLALVKERLDQENIVFEYLDGQTRNREEKVQNFQKNDEILVFLISLKAGGTGLNLTKAEYVFLIDPWWNPAVENQAIDRCYRIGQTKNVMAYRMICKNTIEEKIVDLQESKKEVSSSIIQIDKQSKSFDKAKIAELFG